MRSASARLVFTVFCLVLALPQTSFGSTFTTFDVPNSNGVVPTAVNKWGSVAGYYGSLTGNGYNGFIYQASTGVVATFGVPGISRTYALSINDSGWVVGYYPDKSGVNHGFLRNPKYTTLDAPGAGTLSGQGTQALSINDAGEICGVYLDANSTEHGFTRDASGNYTSFDVSGDSAVIGAWLNQGGQVGGTYYTNSGAGNVAHGYVMGTDGTMTTFDAPQAATGTYLVGVNASGETTGYDYLAGEVIQEFVRDEFGNISSFSIPGYGFTAGIEDNGTAIGVYKNASKYHGWKRTAAGVISYFNDPSAGSAGTYPTCVSSNGKVAGTYADSSGKTHAFLMVN